MKLGNRGQMRVVEAMIACVILIIGISTTAYFSSVFTAEEGGEIEEAGQGVLCVLDNTDLIKQIIQNDVGWESKLKCLLETLLPPDTFYNLTLVSGLTGQPIAAVTNMIGQDPSLSLDAVSLQQITTISLPLARVEYRELDVILVIDRSGSMDDKEPGDQYSKFYYAKEAAMAFVGQLNASKDRVGIVSFAGDDDQYSDDDATLDSPLTNNLEEVKTVINNLRIIGPVARTNMGAGFAKANEEFMAHNRSGAICAVIFVSDGVANRPCPHYPMHTGDEPCPVAQQYARNESKKLSDNDVLIYTIGLGAETWRFDEQLLKDIQTSGYYYAPSGKDLMDIYMAIAQDLLFAVKYEIVVLTLTLVKAE